MRVWLVDEKNGSGTSGLEAQLRELHDRPGNSVQLLGASPFQPDFAEAMRKLVPDLLDVVVVNERAWPEGACTQDILDLGLGMLVVAASERVERFRSLAEVQPINFVTPGVTAEGLWLALLGSFTSQRRQLHWRTQVARLQRRLNDRIIIERAKGILVQRLKISEEEAYKRLRVLSRRQRRQIRDIAQSLLDTQVLFLPETDGFAAAANDKLVPEVENELS